MENKYEKVKYDKYFGTSFMLNLVGLLYTTDAKEDITVVNQNLQGQAIFSCTCDSLLELGGDRMN